jgi:hypothetical protein
MVFIRTKGIETEVVGKLVDTPRFAAELSVNKHC